MKIKQKPATVASKIKFILFFITLIEFSLMAFSAEDTAKSSKEAKSSKAEAEVKQEDCPIILQKWVTDDLNDQHRFIYFKFQSEAKNCQADLRSYQEILRKKSDHKVIFQDARSLGAYFSKEFSPKISTGYSQILDSCNALPNEAAPIIQTRFYSASIKLEAQNSLILDEVALIDSILPGAPKQLNGFECGPYWPEIAAKCARHKNDLASCAGADAREKRLDDLVAKTERILPEIEALKVAYGLCFSKFSREFGYKLGGKFAVKTEKKIKENCQPIAESIKKMRQIVPWVVGDEFKKLVVKRAPNERANIYSSDYDMSKPVIRKAIEAQLVENRATFVNNYSENLSSFRCLSARTPSESKDCDFKKIRTHLQRTKLEDDFVFPTFKNLNNGNQFQKEAKIYLQAEQCLVEKHEEREKEIKNIEGFRDGTITALATAGFGVAALPFSSGTKLSSAVRLGLVTSQVGYNLKENSEAIMAAYESCASESKKVIALRHSNKNENPISVCDRSNSSYDRAIEDESNCYAQALLSIPAVLPFVAAVPGAMKFFPTLAKLRAKPKPESPVSQTPHAQEVKTQDVKKPEAAPAPSAPPKVVASEVASDAPAVPGIDIPSASKISEDFAQRYEGTLSQSNPGNRTLFNIDLPVDGHRVVVGASKPTENGTNVLVRRIEVRFQGNEDVVVYPGSVFGKLIGDTVHAEVKNTSHSIPIGIRSETNENGKTIILSSIAKSEWIFEKVSTAATSASADEIDVLKKAFEVATEIATKMSAGLPMKLELSGGKKFTFDPKRKIWIAD